MHPTWIDRLLPFINSDKYAKITNRIVKDSETYSIYPRTEDTFNAFNFEFNKLKVVIVGQDPYHRQGQAIGLSFAVSESTNDPPSLKNIYKEMDSDVGSHHKLGIHHSDQGVLLLNAALSVIEAQPGSHVRLWGEFTEFVINIINTKDDVVWLLWGNTIRPYSRFITNNSHTILYAAHPSPLARGAFFGCKHFSKCNQVLTDKGYTPIIW